MPPEGLNCSVRVRTAFNSSSRRDFFPGGVGGGGVPVQFEFVFGRSCHRVVRVQSEFEGGLRIRVRTRRDFFPGGGGVSSSVRVRAELTMDLLIPIAIGFV